MKIAQDLENIQKEAMPNFQFASTQGGIGNIVSSLINYLFPLAGLLLLLFLIAGGFQMMLSKGDPKAMQAAKGKISNALIGFIIVFAAYWIVQLVASLLGIEAIKSIF